jgi:hypothetical protein
VTGEIFGDDVMAALIDRLVHHCHRVTIRGNSYRMRQHAVLADPAHRARFRTELHSPATRSSGGRDDLSLVPSPNCQIFNRRNCQILARR